MNIATPEKARRKVDRTAAAKAKAKARARRKAAEAEASYVWRPGARCKGDAQEVGREFERIMTEHGGSLTPPAVVDAARPEDSRLHPHFTWNDWAAAEKCREEEARGLIRSVQLAPRGDADADALPRIAWVHVTTEQGEGVYVTSARAMSDEDMHREALADATALLRGLRRRYEFLHELRGVLRAIDELPDPE